MKKENLKPFEELDEFTEFGSYLCNMDTMKFIGDITDLGGKVWVYDDDNPYDTIYIDVTKINKKDLIKMFVMIGKHKPNEIDEIGHNMIRIWWD